jgi:hypothetical protein
VAGSSLAPPFALCYLIPHSPRRSVLAVAHLVVVAAGGFGMKKVGRNLVAVAAIGTLVVGLVGCKKETAAERAAKQFDKATDNVKDAVKDLKK